MLCGSLLLNADSFRRHLKSKKHQKKLERWPDDTDDPIRLATDVEGSCEEAETHAERMQVGGLHRTQ